MPPEYQVIGSDQNRRRRLASKKQRAPSNLSCFTCYAPAWLSAYLVLATARTFQLAPSPTPLAGRWSATRNCVHTRTHVTTCQFLLRTGKLVPGFSPEFQGHHTDQALSHGTHSPAPSGWLMIYLKGREGSLLISPTMLGDTREP